MLFPHIISFLIIQVFRCNPGVQQQQQQANEFEDMNPIFCKNTETT